MSRTIGVVGGIGPYAGLDIVRKIFDHTLARVDQEHLPVLLFSTPGLIVDRTEYLLGRVLENPGHAIARVLGALETSGAEVAGIACNTAHAPPIFQVIADDLHQAGSRLRLLSMTDEVIRFLRGDQPEVRRVGILATTGTVQSRAYDEPLEREGLSAVHLEDDEQRRLVHDAIYHSGYGIKSGVVTPEATRLLERALERLRDLGAQCAVLACTEIPLALAGTKADLPLPTIDANLALARALIREAAPERLRLSGT